MASDSDRPLLQQAPVAPLDASGFTASVVGTVLFSLVMAASLTWDFPEPWPSILFAGIVLGAVLIAYTAWHHNRALKSALEAKHSTISAPSATDAIVAPERTDEGARP